MSADPNELRRARREARRRQIRRRRLTLLALLVGVAAATAVGVVVLGGSSGSTSAAVVARPAAAVPVRAIPIRRSLPPEVRGVHITGPLASLDGRIDQYLAIPGLNTVELDVKDENGEIGFVRGAPALARQIGAAKPYYDAAAVARKVHKAGVYLIGRVVSFEDPSLSAARPDRAVHLPDGSIWKTSGGLGWLNPYDRRNWDYDVQIGEAAARAGFDEIQFDYVRFPSDGDLSLMRFSGAADEPKAWTIARYVHYASTRIHRLHARVSVDVFGLSATHELGIGQRPGRVARYVDAVYPMVYPSHYTAGEFNLPDPNAAPQATVSDSLRDFRRVLRGSHARLVPWLQDFSLGRTYTLADVRAQIEAARLNHPDGFLLWNAGGVYTDGALTGP